MNRIFRCAWVALLGVVFAGEAGAKTPTVVADLRCEFLKTPLGIDDPRPALSWTIRDERRGVVQVAYQVWVATSAGLLAQNRGDLWESGEIASDRSHLVSYAGRALQSRQRCFWKVQVKVRALGESRATAVWSEPTWWEMGLISPADWQGSWIESTACRPIDNEDTRRWSRLSLVPPERNETRNNAEGSRAIRTAAQQKLDAVLPAPVFHTTFEIPGVIKRARIYLSGLGFHEATINGQPVSDHLHDPSVMQYKFRGGYVTHDIGSLVRPGHNAITIAVGGGYFNEPIVWGNPGKVDGQPSLRAQVEIELTDGRRVVVATDKSWRTAIGPLLKTHYWAGEVYDARRTAGHGDATWSAVTEVAAPVPTLVAQRCEPERIIRRLTPVALTQPRPGIWVFDLGEIIVGTFELRVKLPVGTRVALRTAEWTWNPSIQGPKFAVSRLHYDDDVFSDHGLIETCYDMMNATGFPSFAYQLQSGNRTIPEGPAWTDRFPAFASAYQNECQEPARWFTQTLCGVSPDRNEPGFKHILLRPRFPARLPSAKLVTTTPYGTLESSWTQQAGTVTWTVRIPANSRATAWIPATRADLVREGGRPLSACPGGEIRESTATGIECRLAAGVYEFRFPAPANAASRLSELK